MIGWAMSQSRTTGCWTSFGFSYAGAGGELAEVERVGLGGRVGLHAVVDDQVVSAALDVACDGLALGLLGRDDGDVGAFGGRGRIERVDQVSVARRDRQHLGLARGPDDREGAVVHVERVLDREADLVRGQADVGQVELERLVGLRAELRARSRRPAPRHRRACRRHVDRAGPRWRPPRAGSYGRGRRAGRPRACRRRGAAESATIATLSDGLRNLAFSSAPLAPSAGGE